MKWTILVLACGLCACGDNRLLPADASPGAPIDASNPPPLDGPGIDANPNPGLILRYDFEDSPAGTVVADTSGRALDGTLSDVAAWTANGRDGRGVAFSAPNGIPATQFVSLPSGVLTGVDDFTISAWVNANSVGNWARIYDFGNGLPDPDSRWMFLTLRGFVVAPNSPPPPNVVFQSIGLHASSFGGSPTNEIVDATNTEIPPGVWKHLTVTGSGGVRVLYVDGYPAIRVTSTIVAPPKDMEPLAGNSWLGKSRFPSDAGLDGTLDDFRIYNRVLSAPEIEDLAWPKTDYSYWRFDEGAGSTAKDSSDNHVPTVLVGGASWAAGQLGGAVDLGGAPGDSTGAGPHVSFATSPLAGCDTSLTIAVWVKLRHSDNFARIVDFGTGGGTFIFLAATDGAGLRLGMGKTNVDAFNMTASNAVPADNAWHHVALTIDPTELVSMYLDGQLVVTPTTVTLEKPLDYATSTENYVGRSRFPSDPYLNGSIDELRISCRAFTAGEIKNLAFAGPLN